MTAKAEPQYAVCRCGCQRFHAVRIITSRGKVASFRDGWRCDDCGRNLPLARRVNGENK